MANINLKLLQTFVLVAEHGSFRRAAAECLRTPSAVSMQIKTLEDQIGVALFMRTTRRVELTLEGRMLLDRVQRTLDDLSEGLDELTDAVSARRGVVTLASSPTIAATRLPAIVAAFQARFPKAVVRVRELQSTQIVDAVSDESVDFGLGPLAAGRSRVDFAPLFEEELYAVVPEGHPLARRQRVPLAALAGCPMIVLSSMAALRSVVDEAVAGIGITLDIRYEAQQPQTVIAFVNAGVGIAVLPRIMLPELGPGVRALPLCEPVLRRTLCIISRPGHRPSPLVGEFKALVSHMLVAGF
ncbi:LysR substrate-binding domain-containing protein [Alcaligenaceae bacterium C4P045]|nr:LysR substrate-binding domain-containing protein [Alcaligenaceae bacterium C4P045]